MYPMLVLSRKVGQRILIGDQVAVTVVRVSQGTVRLGIEAPPETPIVREELKDALAAADRVVPAAPSV
jgi:carbon storage regulator